MFLFSVTKCNIVIFLFSEKMSAYLSKDEVQTFLQRSKYFNKKFSKSTSTYYFQNTLDAMKLIYLQYFLPDKQTKLKVCKKMRGGRGPKSGNGILEQNSKKREVAFMGAIPFSLLCTPLCV